MICEHSSYDSHGHHIVILFRTIGHRCGYSYWISAAAAQQLTYDSLNFIDEENPTLFTSSLDSWSSHKLLVIYDVEFPLAIHHPELFV